MIKDWKPDDWVRIILSVAVAYFICTIVTGMVLMKVATNDNNKDLRMAIVILITTIVNHVLNNKPNKDKL